MQQKDFCRQKMKLTPDFSGVDPHNQLRLDRDETRAGAGVDLLQSWMWIWGGPPTISSGWTEIGLKLDLEWLPSPNSGQKIQHKYGSGTGAGVDPTTPVS